MVQKTQLQLKYKMYLKIHKTEERIIISLCDEDLVGKKFTEKNLQLAVNERFYKGDKITEKEAIPILKEAWVLNIVGEKSIKAALKAKAITKENIIKIQGIPHAQSIAMY